jgi:hypothetical protein
MPTMSREEFVRRVREAKVDTSKPQPWQVRFEDAERRKDQVRRELYQTALREGGIGAAKRLMRRYGKMGQTFA